MEEIISSVIELMSLGICITCGGKDLNEFCPTCQFCNGISKEEAVYNRLSLAEVLQLAKERNIN